VKELILNSFIIIELLQSIGNLFNEFNKCFKRNKIRLSATSVPVISCVKLTTNERFLHSASACMRFLLFSSFSVGCFCSCWEIVQEKRERQAQIFVVYVRLSFSSLSLSFLTPLLFFFIVEIDKRIMTFFLSKNRVMVHHQFGFLRSICRFLLLKIHICLLYYSYKTENLFFLIKVCVFFLFNSQDTNDHKH